MTTPMPVAAQPLPAHGILAEVGEDSIILAIPHTDYRLHLLCDAAATVGKVDDRVSGVIRGVARRVDVVPAGGRYIEPVYGRPRRIQGWIKAIDPVDRTLTVHAGAAPVTVTLGDTRQKVTDFCVDQLVSFDIERGATWTAT